MKPYRINYRNEKCKNCAIIGDSRWITEKCHHSIEKKHPNYQLEKYHNLKLIKWHPKEIGYFHSSSSEKYHDKATKKYHPLLTYYKHTDSIECYHEGNEETFHTDELSWCHSKKQCENHNGKLVKYHIKNDYYHDGLEMVHNGSLVNYHNDQLIYYHPEQTLKPYHPFLRNNSYTHPRPLIYIHPQECRDVSFDRDYYHEQSWSVYHTGNFENVFLNVNQWNCCGKRQVYDKGCETGYPCCRRTNRNDVGCRRRTETRRLYSCCDQEQNQRGCVQVYECCRSAINSISCVYPCCGKTNEGCRNKFLCCDGDSVYKSEGCKKKFKCCNQNDISLGCKKKIFLL